MRASNYLPLPKELKAEYGCLDIQTNDKKLFSVVHPSIVTSRKAQKSSDY